MFLEMLQVAVGVASLALALGTVALVAHSHYASRTEVLVQKSSSSAADSKARIVLPAKKVRQLEFLVLFAAPANAGSSIVKRLAMQVLAIELIHGQFLLAAHTGCYKARR